MKLVNLRKILCFALAMIFCLGITVFPSETVEASASPVSSSSASYNEPIVRVGLYTNSNGKFSSLNVSNTGFEIGYSSGDVFTKLFTLSQGSIIILPQVNASFNGGSCVAGNGDIGSYSAVKSTHSSYSSALSAANACGGFVAVVNGGYEARYASANSAEEVSAKGGKKVSAPSGLGITVLDTNGNILFTFEDTSRRFAIRACNGGTVQIPVDRSNFSYYGHFEYSTNGQKLLMVNCVGLETYTKCVITNEIGSVAPRETRKAFSILVRTFALLKKHGNEYHVCNSQCCQVYFGTYRMGENGNNEIVDSTRGIYCTYKGAPISALYHVSNGGASCSSLAAWGGNDIPYLKTVYLDETTENDKWTHEFTKQEFYEYLTKRRTFSSLADSDLSVKILETDPYGSDYITVLSVSDGSGNTVQVETSETIRTACGFKSANFDVEFSADEKVLTADGTVEERKVTGVLTENGYEEFEGFDQSYTVQGGGNVEAEKIVINGVGAGHGVGFSMVGAELLGNQGYNYEYIINFFYQGTKLQQIG